MKKWYIRLNKEKNIGIRLSAVLIILVLILTVSACIRVTIDLPDGQGSETDEVTKDGEVTEGAETEGDESPEDSEDETGEEDLSAKSETGGEGLPDGTEAEGNTAPEAETGNEAGNPSEGSSADPETSDLPIDAEPIAPQPSEGGSGYEAPGNSGNGGDIELPEIPIDENELPPIGG